MKTIEGLFFSLTEKVSVLSKEFNCVAEFFFFSNKIFKNEGVRKVMKFYQSGYKNKYKLNIKSPSFSTTAAQREGKFSIQLFKVIWDFPHNSLKELFHLLCFWMFCFLWNVLMT